VGCRHFFGLDSMIFKHQKDATKNGNGVERVENFLQNISFCLIHCSCLKSHNVFAIFSRKIIEVVKVKNSFQGCKSAKGLGELFKIPFFF